MFAVEGCNVEAKGPAEARHMPWPGWVGPPNSTVITAKLAQAVGVGSKNDLGHDDLRILVSKDGVGDGT